MAALMLSLSAFGGCGTKPETKELPDYDKTGTDIMISSWGCPKPNAEEFQIYKECGFNAMFLTQVNSYYDGYPDCKDPADLWEKYLTLGDEFGLDIYPHMHNAYQADLSQKMVDTAKKHPSYAGMHWADEPAPDKFGDIAARVPAYESALPGTTFCVNLLPSYSVLFAEDKITSYQNYIESYCKSVLSLVEGEKYLSVDSYPIIQQGLYFMDYLFDLGVLAKYAKKFDANSHMCIQSIMWDNEGGNGNSDHFRELTEEDIRIQVYTSLAFGIHSLSYFTYAPCGGMEVEKSCVDAEGNKTEYYDYVKTVNRELNDFSKIYTSFTWNGVMTLKEGSRVPAAFMSLNELTDILYTVEDLDSVASAAANGNVVCGVFEDGEKNEGFLFVNYADSKENKKVTIDLGFTAANKLLVVRKGEKTIVDVKNKRYSLELDVCEGVFAVPYVG